MLEENSEAHTFGNPALWTTFLERLIPETPPGCWDGFEDWLSSNLHVDHGGKNLHVEHGGMLCYCAVKALFRALF